jgi:sugar phosphate isomerase/epimerase
MQIGLSLSPLKTPFGPLLFAGDLTKGLASAEELGFDGVELSLLDSNTLDQDEIVESVHSRGLQVHTIATGQSFHNDGLYLFSPDPAIREQTVRRVAGHIDFAAKLGSMVILGGIRGRTAGLSPEARREASRQGTEAIRQCVEHAHDHGVALLIEPVNRYETDSIHTVEQGLELIRKIDSPSLKLLPDTFHMNIEEASLSESIRSAGERIGYLHFADSNRRAPGWGHIDIPGIFSALKSIGYRGPIGVEILPLPDDLSAARQAIRYLRQCDEEDD